MITASSAPAGDRILEPMLTFSRCAKHHRMVVAGAKAVELMLELQRRGYLHAASTANCGQPAAQYDFVLVDWRRRTTTTLEAALDWLSKFLKPEGTLVIWIDPLKSSARANLHALLESHGLTVTDGTVHDFGCAVSARRKDANPIRKAA